MKEHISSRVELAKSAEHAKDAFHIFSECAEAGNGEAQSNLGLLYYLGEGVERSIPLAIYWLEKARDQGFGDAAHNLGTLYLTCEPDLPRDPEKARNCFLKAYELGFIVTSEEFYESLRDPDWAPV